MATHTSILAWRILWTEEPGGLQSIVSQRVRHNWSNLAHNTQSQDWISIWSWRKFITSWIPKARWSWLGWGWEVEGPSSIKRRSQEKGLEEPGSAGVGGSENRLTVHLDQAVSPTLRGSFLWLHWWKGQHPSYLGKRYWSHTGGAAESPGLLHTVSKKQGGAGGISLVGLNTQVKYAGIKVTKASLQERVDQTRMGNRCPSFPPISGCCPWG